jgi:hypothetical protein
VFRKWLDIRRSLVLPGLNAGHGNLLSHSRDNLPRAGELERIAPRANVQIHATDRAGLQQGEEQARRCASETTKGRCRASRTTATTSRSTGSPRIHTWRPRGFSPGHSRAGCGFVKNSHWLRRPVIGGDNRAATQYRNPQQIEVAVRNAIERQRLPRAFAWFGVRADVERGSHDSGDDVRRGGGLRLLLANFAQY